MMRRAMTILRDRERSKDVVQEVAVRLWQRPQTLDSTDNPYAYCLAAVRNAAISELRTAMRFESLEEAIFIETDSEDKDSHTYLKALLSHLPEAQRSVFEMRQLRDMEYEEIAESLSTTPANVRQLLSRARKTLRTLYKQDI